MEETPPWQGLALFETPRVTQGWMDAAAEASPGVSPLSSQRRGLPTGLSPCYLLLWGWCDGRWWWLQPAGSPLRGVCGGVEVMEELVAS